MDTALSDLLNRFDKLKNKKKQQIQDRAVNDIGEDVQKYSKVDKEKKGGNVQDESKDAKEKGATASGQYTQGERKAAETTMNRRAGEDLAQLPVVKVRHAA